MSGVFRFRSVGYLPCGHFLLILLPYTCFHRSVKKLYMLDWDMVHGKGGEFTEDEGVLKTFFVMFLRIVCFWYDGWSGYRLLSRSFS